MLAHAINFISEGVVITTPELDDPYGPKIIYVNDAVCKLTGYSRDELIGKTPRIFHGPATKKEDRKIIKDQLKLNQYCHQVIRNYKKDGTFYWAELNIYPVFENDNEENKLIYWIAIQRDVTQEVEIDDLMRSKFNELKYKLVHFENKLC